MPSDNILIAIDAIQAALATLDLASGEGTAFETLQSINDNIDAIRLSIDTRSEAEVTAQNTNFSDLIDAIAALACSPTVYNYVTVQGGSAGCCGSGCEPPSLSGEEGDTPPDGWTDPPGVPSEPGLPGSSAYYSRKCKMANAIHENIVGLVSALNDAGLDDLTFPMLGAAIGFAIGFSTPVPLLDDVALTVVGFLSGLVLAYWSWKAGMDLAQLLLDLDACEDDLVCALYSSTDGQSALDAYLDVLDTYGTSVGNLAFLQAVIVIDLVNRLYFVKDPGEEAALETYTPSISCDCGCTFVQIDTHDYTNGSNLVDNGTNIEITAVYRPIDVTNCYMAHVWFNATTSLGAAFCGSKRRITSIDILSGSITKHTFPFDIYGHHIDEYNSGNAVGQDTLDTDLCLTGMQIISSTAFSIRMNLASDC